MDAASAAERRVVDRAERARPIPCGREAALRACRPPRLWRVRDLASFGRPHQLPE